MDNITIGNVKELIITISTVGAALIGICAWIKHIIGKMLLPLLKSDIATLMYLAEQGQLSDTQKRLAHDEFDEYKKLGGNSYIKDNFEKLVKEGKL